MALLRFPGLQTGIDTSSIIEQLMMLERRTLNTWENRKSLWEEKQTALSDIESKLGSLRTSLRALSDAGELKAYSVSSSDTDYLTAEATNNAFEGNHTVVINQLATAERWVHSDGKEYAEDYVGAGTFMYSYNNEQTTITTTATTTLEDFVGLINNDANNPGVTASMLYYNDAYHLVLNGNDAGLDYRIAVDSSSIESLEADSAFTLSSDNATLSTKISDIDQFSGLLDGDEKIEITGTDHNGNAIAQVDLTVTENTKLSHLIDEINDAFYGIAIATMKNGKIVLTDLADGSSDLTISLNYSDGNASSTLTLPTMAVSTEGGSTSASLSGFAQSDFTQTQSALDSLIKVDGYPSSSAVSELQTLSPSSPAGSGTFTLTYLGQTTSALNYNADAATIQVAMEALSTVNTGDITVEGGGSGFAGGDVTFTFANTLGDVSMLAIDDSGLDVSVTATETTKGVPAWISRSSNTVDDVISGVTLHLHDVTDSGGEKITLTRDIDSVKDKINSMVFKYNSAVEYIKEKTGYNEYLETAGILMGDYVVSTMRYKLRSPLIEQTKGFIEDIDTHLMPANIGLELDKDGVLSFNENTFDEAVASDYMGALAIIGADKTGSSTSNTIKFYGASESYTTAGEYNVQVTISGGVITSAKIKLSSESTYRDMAVGDNVITGTSTFDTNGDPVYAENGLQLNVDLSSDGDYTATVRVRQGFTGKIEDTIDRMLKATVGSLVINQDRVDDQIEILDDKIELEEYRLEKRETRLIARFARLERTLSLLQNQMAVAGIMNL